MPTCSRILKKATTIYISSWGTKQVRSYTRPDNSFNTNYAFSSTLHDFWGSLLLLSANSVCQNPQRMALPLLAVTSNCVLTECLQLAYLWLERRPAQSLCINDLPQHLEFSNKSLQPLSALPVQRMEGKEEGRGFQTHSVCFKSSSSGRQLF